MGKRTGLILKYYLLFGAIYLTGDALVHLFNIKISDVLSIWPPSALDFARLLNQIYASFVILAAVICFEMQRNLVKYKSLVFLSAVWAFWHGLLLIYISLSLNFAKSFNGFESLYVWIPFYNSYLLFESFLLISYSILALYWKMSVKNEE